MKHSYVIQVDCMHDYVQKLPSTLLAVMGYVTGTTGVKWTQADWDRFPYAGKLTVDQSFSLDMLDALKANIGDVETGAASIDRFAYVAEQRAKVGHGTILYISESGLANAKAKMAGIASHVQYFVADYTWGMEKGISIMEADDSIIGVQFASPSSNPRTVLPGSTLTLAQANADLSVKRADIAVSPVPAAIGWRE